MNTFLAIRRSLALLACAVVPALVAAPPQSVQITAPNDGDSLGELSSPNNSVTITAAATPSSGSAFITQVEFRVNGTLISTDPAAPFSAVWTPTAAGTYTITATATDSSAASNNTLTSAPVTVTVSAVRTVAVTSPAANTTIAQNSAIYVRGSAAMTDGIVSSVEFFLTSTAVGSTPVSLGTATSSPYNRQATLSAAPGPYTLTAHAIGSNGAGFDSSAIPITIAAPVGTGPTATITAPASTDVIAAGTNITVIATATDTDGTVTNVTFFADGEQIGSPDTSAPYSVTWTPTAVKSYVLTAIATDNNSNARISTSVSVTVQPSAATVSITAPVANATAAVGVPVTVTANATASSGSSISSVQFFANGDPITNGTDTAAPYSVSWTPQNTGAVTLTARATDSNNVVVTSAGVAVNVANAGPPTVAITAPAGGATVALNATVNINANATAANGLSIVSVQFLENGAPISNGTDTSAPFGIAWSPSSSGTKILTATAVDSAGGTSTSNPVIVNVSGTAPALNVALALTGSVSIPMGSARALTATVTPATGIDHVELLYDGSVVASDASAPYNFLFTAPETLGSHQLTARAFDATGQTTTSSPVAITITGVSSTPPLVGILTPSANAFIGPATATTITGTASDVDGFVTGVQVFVNGSTAGLANNGIATLNGSNWSIAWTTPTTSVPISIVAVATDNSGNAVASPPVVVSVGDTASPAITLSFSPAVANQPAPTTLPSGAVRNVLATTTASPGRAVVRVEFFVDGTKVGEDTAAPFTFRYVAPDLAPDEQSHTYVLSARATDNAGAARDVQQTILVVAPVGLKPTVSLLTPTSNTSVTPGSAVSMAAIASANGGTITSVQFYVNGSPANITSGNINGTAIVNPPYTAQFTPPAPGTYTIDAIATDDRGNTAISNSATVTAAFTTPTIVFNTPNPNATARATPNVPLTLTATATVQSGTGAAVLLVEFLLDGVQIGARTVANGATGASATQYTFSWIPTAAQLGQHELTARVTDTNGQTVTSAPIQVNVANVIGSPPTVSVAAVPIPAVFGLQTASTVNFVATAVATGGSTLRNVEIFLNDISIGIAAREQSTNFYRIAYDLNRFDFSTVTPTVNDVTGAVTYPVRLYAIARDSNNNQTVSSTVNLVINPATSSPPSIQLTPAANISNITVGTQFFMQANINDLDGVVTSIQLYANGSPVGAAVANPQQGQLIAYTANNAGRFNLYAVATDDTGNTAVSSPSIVINVTAVTAPTTTITRPTDNNTRATVGSPVFLEGTAVNTATTQVPTLQFIATAAGGSRQVINGIRVGTTTTYRAVWIPNNPDTYTVTTQAAVGQVSGTSSISRRVVVTEIVGLAPTVTLQRTTATGVAAGVPTTATTASTADFSAIATDPDGSIVDVEFYLNRNSIGHARKDPQGDTWRITASFAGLLPGATEVVALATDTSGNISDSPTSSINVTAARSIAPSITVTPSTTNPAFNRQVQLRSNARDSDGNVTSVQYFANATSIATTTNSGSLFLTNWTPTASGTYYIWAVATDNTGITTVSPTLEMNVRRNNPVLENSAFILQTYQDIANTTNINPLVFDGLDEQLANGSLTRADIIVTPLVANGGLSLTQLSGFQAPVNLLAIYYVLMGQWPTPANYTTFLATARNSLPNAVLAILNSNEYFAKYGVVPTTALLDNPNSALTAEEFLNRLHQAAGIRPPEPLDRVTFRSNNALSATRGRGYTVVSLQQAIAEFVTNTNSTNTALFAKARAAALFYQLTRPSVTVTVDEITARIDALLKLSDEKAIANAVLNDVLYGYRYVTITKHPQSLVIAPRSGAIFTVEAQGAPPLAYQWLLNGAPISGATNPTLSLTDVTATRVGSYTVAITSPAATATSDAALLTLSNTPTKLANISTRGVTTSGANVLIGGFVVQGTNQTQTRQMLIRVVGPRLGTAPFNVQGALADPSLAVFNGSNATPVLTNDNWSTQTGGAAQVTAVQQATTRAGAFALNANSLDAAVLATLPPGSYTVQANVPASQPNASGVVLIEAYDVTPNANAAGRAMNVSTRGSVGTGTNILIAGFVVNGGVSRRVLIRGVGPTLTRFGLAANAVLADPQLTLINQDTGKTIATNNDWAAGDDAATIAAASTAAGAFALTNGSKDAAMIVMLQPGTYTVQLSGVNNGTGIAIVEVYDVDP